MRRKHRQTNQQTNKKHTHTNKHAIKQTKIKPTHIVRETPTSLEKGGGGLGGGTDFEMRLSPVFDLKEDGNEGELTSELDVELTPEMTSSGRINVSGSTEGL